MTMYAVVYWGDIKGKVVIPSDNFIQIIKNKDGSVWIADTIKQADKKANELEKKLGLEIGSYARVISLDMVHE